MLGQLRRRNISFMNEKKNPNASRLILFSLTTLQSNFYKEKKNIIFFNLKKQKIVFSTFGEA